jgi:glycosyltransferase involved in cell wall biosynthesis
VTFLGQVPPAEASAEIARARLLVLPSICFEGFPMVLQEAFAFGTPMAVSEVGPLPSIVKDGATGVTFGAGSHEALLHRVRELWKSGALEGMSERARAEYEACYREQANYERLIEIYENAMASKLEHPQ